MNHKAAQQEKTPEKIVSSPRQKPPMNRRRTYRPQTAQIPAEPLRGNPCDSHDPRRFPRDPRRHSSPAHPILNSSFLILNCTYTFSAKEKDPETGYSYFGSRYYNSDLSVWLSVDPMAAKYPSLSPYTYCADNPVKSVDPNGEDYVVVVEGNTITIKAKYYVTKDTRKGVEEAIRNFKEQAPYLSYTSQEGKTYSIKFDLTIAGEFDTPEQAKQAKKDNGKCGYANYCVSGETLIPDGSDKPALGQTLKGTDITIRTDRANDDYRTFIHEIGHTLGFGHWMFGVMGGDPGDTQIFDEYIQQSMYRAGFSETQSLSTSFNFSTDDMWKYVGKGKVIIKTKKR
ncbi:MAG: hypothetical protein K5901_05225 [Bacteroidales bacterium]|nr:hypothetical protein [Bacteroidales bacterium]